MSTNKRYSEDFKKTIVDLYNSGHSVKEISSEYGISDVAVYKWIKKFSPIKNSNDEITSLDDLEKLKKQIARLQGGKYNIKKGYNHIRKRISKDQIFEVITQNSNEHSVKTMCDVFEIPRSSYYDSLSTSLSKRALENKELESAIYDIYIDSKSRYGAPKIHYILSKKGYTVSLKRVQRIMRKLGIRAITVKKYRPYSKKQICENRENIINRDFTSTSINEKWVTDITYIHTIKNGWSYLASVMDLHSRKIIGYSFDTSMTVDLALQAVKNAYATQKPKKQVILHSDLGSQYTSNDFADYLHSKNIEHSFSQKGCPYDNATIESFHSILKKEEVHHVKYLDFKTAKLALFKYIEGWYNRKRIHGALDYKTPREIEDEASIAS